MAVSSGLDDARGASARLWRRLFSSLLSAARIPGSGSESLSRGERSSRMAILGEWHLHWQGLNPVWYGHVRVLQVTRDDQSRSAFWRHPFHDRRSVTDPNMMDTAESVDREAEVVQALINEMRKVEDIVKAAVATTAELDW